MGKAATITKDSTVKSNSFLQGDKKPFFQHPAYQLSNFGKHFFKPAPNLIQLKCDESESEENLQRKESMTPYTELTESSANLVKSSGEPLDTKTKSFMESRMGHDFSNVRIHNDSWAKQSSDEIDALAYTHGNHVVFGENQYQPGTQTGKELLAHELVHVIQQEKHTGAEQKIFRTKKKKKRKKTEQQLRRYGFWPDEAMDAWKSLSAEEQEKVYINMIGFYGVPFTARFQEFAKLKNRRSCTFYSTIGVTESRKSLEARGYRLVDVFMGVTERWVNSNCDLLYRTIPSPSTSAAQPASVNPPTDTNLKDKAGPVVTEETTDDGDVSYSIDTTNLDWKNPGIGHGSIKRTSQNLSKLNLKGKANEYADGAIVIYDEESGSSSLLIPEKGKGKGLYIWISEGIIMTDYELDTDALF